MQTTKLELLGLNRLSNVRDPLIVNGEKVYFEIAYHYGLKKTCLEICIEHAHKAATGIMLFFKDADAAGDWIKRTYNAQLTASQF